MTRITTPVSGANTDEFNERRERLLGELEELMEGDCYWGICVRLWRLLSRKRGYYGCRENPLENALGVAQDGIEPWRYQVARIGEKCRRLRGSLGTIDIVRTLLDIAGHSVVGIACLEVPDEPELAALAADAPRSRCRNN